MVKLPKSFWLIAPFATWMVLMTAYGDVAGWEVISRHSPEARERVNALQAAMTAEDESSPTLRSRSMAVSADTAIDLRLSHGLPAIDHPRVRELAHGLDNDPWKCFAYVRDNVRFAPYFGFVRGPERTLLDGVGNDADQALLLVALLQAAGFADAHLALTLGSDSSYLQVPLSDHDGSTSSNVLSWLGLVASGDVDSDFAAARDRLGPSVLGCSLRILSGVPYVRLSHFQVSCRGTRFDPSFKPSLGRSPRSVLSDSEYSRTSLLSAAGGSVSLYAVSGLSTNGLSNYLNARVARLRTCWTNENQSASFYIGRRPPLSLAENVTAQGTVVGNANFDSLGDSSKALFRYEATLVHGSGLRKSFFLDELADRDIWIRYDQGSSAYPKAALCLGDDVLSSESGSVSSGTASLDIVVSNAFCSSSPHRYGLKRSTSSVYAIPLGTSGDSGGGLRLVAAQRLAASSGDARRRRAIALWLAGVQWASQCSLSDRISNDLLGTDYTCLFRLGISAQESSPYLDMANCLAQASAGMEWLSPTLLFDSALEHAVLDQLNGGNAPAVSTVRVLALANASRDPVFLAHAANYSSIKSQLDYSTQTKTLFQQAVSEGHVLLLPKRAQYSLNDWAGSGYIDFCVTALGNQTGMIISGGLNGGYASEPYEPPVQDYVDQSVSSFAEDGAIEQATSADPVSMPSGAFVQSVTDLNVPGGSSLKWTRHYDSRGRHSSGSMGKGWTHGLEATVAEVTDPDTVFGDGSVGGVLPTAVAVAVANDLLSASQASGLTAGQKARLWLLAALTVQWWTEQTVGKTVSVNLGTQSLRFQRLPDGTYAPAPGVTAALTRTAGGGYEQKERLGPTYRFGADGRLMSLADASGNLTSLTYGSDGRLTRVANAFGAYLNVSWSGERISQVSANGGMSVGYAYDNEGRMTEVRDVAGKRWRMGYDAATGALGTETNPLRELVVSNGYNGAGQVVRQLSDAGGNWTFGYAGTAEAWDEDPQGNRRSRTFDADGRVLVETPRDGNWTAHAYDGHGHVIAETNRFRRVLERNYSGNDLLLSMRTNADGHETAFAYDSVFRVCEVTNALGGVTRFRYDAKGRVTEEAAPDGSSLSNVWSATGLLLSRIEKSPAGSIARRTDWTYASTGLPTSKTVFGVGLPAAGVTETFAYDAKRQMTSRTDANGHVTSFAYNARGQVLSRTDPDGAVTTFAYDDVGRLLRQTDALSRTVAYTYTSFGGVATVSRPDGGVVRNAYDALARLVSTIDARGTVVSTSYDAEGRVVRVMRPSGTETTAYNAAGLPYVMTNPLGGTMRVRYDYSYKPFVVSNLAGRVHRSDYDALDRLVRETDSSGRAHDYGYDALGRRVSSRRPSGATDRFGYDALGNCMAYTNAEGHAYLVSYDALGRMTAATNALGNCVFKATYDGVGNLTSRTDGNGLTTDFYYDVCDRLVLRAGLEGEETFSYDAVGNLTSATGRGANESFAYDACNRLVASVTDVGEWAVTNAWRRDWGGLVTNVVYAPGKCVSRRYDADGRLVEVRDWLGHAWTFSWNGLGQPTGGTSPGGISHSLAYDADGNLLGWNVGTLLGRTIVRDVEGRRLRDTITAGPMPRAVLRRRAQNTYDAADRLTSAWVLRDPETRPVREEYIYDGNGALERIEAEGETLLDVLYDGDGRLMSIGEEYFAEDGLGNRVVAFDRVFVPDHADPFKRPLLECDWDGTVIRHYLWGGGRLLGFVDADGRLTVAHSDEQGSVVALTDEAGATLFVANYGPHGEDWGSSGTNPTPFAWLGGLGVMRIDPSGSSSGSSSLLAHHAPLYLTRHRLYSPTLHRFLSPDPLGPAGGHNLYAYANGDPLAYIDPLGLCASSSLGTVLDYLGESANQVIKGNYTDDVTLLGTAAEIGASFIGLDLPMDARDLAYDLTHWDGSWDSASRTALDAVGLLPIVGVLKFGDEAATLVKRSSGPILETSTVARKAAKLNGWTEVKGVKSKGEAVFTDGKRFFSRDNASHKGGPWKETNSKGERMFTLDQNLRRMGD